MEFFQIDVIQWFAQYAYQPGMVYGAVVILMFASSFGFPVPEEVTLLSLGLLAYAGGHPEDFPPEVAGASPIVPETAAMVALFAVLLSDITVYLLGRYFGKRLVKTRFFLRFRSPRAAEKIQSWTARYGHWACGMFRFTPGLRFPGHLSCGMMGVPIWKFILVDGSAALLSVPTQILLVAYFGDSVLVYFKQFKVVVFAVLALALVAFLFRKWKARGENVVSTSTTPF